MLSFGERPGSRPHAGFCLCRLLVALQACRYHHAPVFHHPRPLGYVLGVRQVSLQIIVRWLRKSA